MKNSIANRRTVLVFITLALVGAAKSQPPPPLAPPALMTQLKWRCIGPYIGGRVVTVTGVPGNNNLFYAGTVGGGVWRSATEGVEWECITL